MSYQLIWLPKSKKALKKLDKQTIERITSHMEIIKISPYKYVERVKSKDYYKTRVGNYRIFVDVKTNENSLEVLTIRHRRNAYKD